MSDALINGLAGAGGGIIAQLITYPLQTVWLLGFSPLSLPLIFHVTGLFPCLANFLLKFEL